MTSSIARREKEKMDAEDITPEEWQKLAAETESIQFDNPLQKFIAEFRQGKASPFKLARKLHLTSLVAPAHAEKDHVIMFFPTETVIPDYKLPEPLMKAIEENRPKGNTDPIQAFVLTLFSREDVLKHWAKHFLPQDVEFKSQKIQLPQMMLTFHKMPLITHILFDMSTANALMFQQEQMQLLLEYAHILMLETALLYLHKHSPYGLPKPDDQSRPQKFVERGYFMTKAADYFLVMCKDKQPFDEDLEDTFFFHNGSVPVFTAYDMVEDYQEKFGKFDLSRFEVRKMRGGRMWTMMQRNKRLLAEKTINFNPTLMPGGYELHFKSGLITSVANAEMIFDEESEEVEEPEDF
jgi:hypothetical protein